MPTRIMISCILFGLMAFVLPSVGAQQDHSSPEFELLKKALSGKYPLSYLQERIDLGCDVNARSADGTTPLMLATLRGRGVKPLLIAGADVNAKGGKFGATPLVPESGGQVIIPSLRVLELLIDYGADVNAPGAHDMNVLLHIAGGKYPRGHKGRLEAVKMLLNRGAEVDARSEGTGKTALMLAVNRGRGLEMATLLIDNCADVNARSRDGHSPLMIAAWGPQLKMVQLLIEKGAEINARGGLLPQNSFPLTALMKMRAGQPVSVADIVEIREASHRKGWQHGRMTPLMYAARFSGNPEIIEYLLKSGADPLVENAHGEKAIDLARQNKALENTPALRKLLEMSVE